MHNGDNELLAQGRNAVSTGARFDAAVPHAEAARDGMIAACLACGVKKDAPIADFVGADIEHCLKGFAQSRFAATGTAAAAGIAATKGAVATALRARVKDQVLIARDAHNDAMPPVVDQWSKRLLKRPWISVPATVVPWLYGLAKLFQEGRDLLSKLTH
jgi:hypothetical protein